MLNDVILGLYNPIRKRIFNIRIQTQYFLSKKKTLKHESNINKRKIKITIYIWKTFDVSHCSINSSKFVGQFNDFSSIYVVMTLNNKKTNILESNYDGY